MEEFSGLKNSSNQESSSSAEVLINIKSKAFLNELMRMLLHILAHYLLFVHWQSRRRTFVGPLSADQVAISCSSRTSGLSLDREQDCKFE